MLPSEDFSLKCMPYPNLALTLCYENAISICSPLMYIASQSHTAWKQTFQPLIYTDQDTHLLARI